MRKDNTIWCLTESNQLKIFPVKVIREEKDHVYLHAELKNGSKVITSPIATPISGMTLEEQKPAVRNSVNPQTSSEK